MSSRSSRTIYVGNLPGDIREREVEDLFYKYGRILDIDLKLPPRPPGYAFVEFEDTRDAEDAIRGRDGYTFCGNRLRVELAHGGRGPAASSMDRHSSYNNSGGGSAGGGSGSGVVGAGGGGGRPGGVSRRSEYRVIITGLPSSASWQDLKDHMRRAGDVCFAQVFREGNGTTGIVDFTNYDDMKYAIKKLDDTEFRNPFTRSFIRVKEDKGRGKKRSMSRSRSRSRSYNHSASRSHSRSRSPRSRSPARSPSRSRSRSPRSVSRSLSRSRSRSPRRSPSPLKHRTRSASHSQSPPPEKSPCEVHDVGTNSLQEANGKSSGRSASPASNDR